MHSRGPGERVKIKVASPMPPKQNARVLWEKHSARLLLGTAHREHGWVLQEDCTMGSGAVLYTSSMSACSVCPKSTVLHQF